MCLRPSRVVALLPVLCGLAGCSGGGAGPATVSFSCVGEDQTAICIQNCNLGCNDNGCARTDIAQNEIVILQFSEAIDPNSVTPSSIRFRTASGEQPNGEFLVNGDTVEFVPTLAISGGQTFFGFGAGETYTMTIPGGDDQPAVVRSTSGKPFARTMTCVLVSSRGIVDLNGVPPSATLILPTVAQVNAAPRNTDIKLEFNEMIDATPFISGTQSPVIFTVRRTKPAPGGGFVCDPESEPQLLTGSQFPDFDPARGVSVLSFRPTTMLPGNVCVEINVTAGVQDLSGKPAQPQTFSFRTEVVPLTEGQVEETFDDPPTFFDADASAGQWGGGVATFSRIGGDGRHGPFSLSLCGAPAGVVEGKTVYRLNTDLTVVPAANTYGEVDVAVTDGRFHFTSMVLPPDVRLEFVGNNNGPATVPPVITVAGRLDISGDISVSGASNTTYIATTLGAAVAQLGQPGAAGGPFGGRGGNGGSKNLTGGGGTLSPACHGENGGSARLRAGHAYAAVAADSGGRGSTVFPANGLNSSLVFLPATGQQYCASASAGGGGGSFGTNGTNGAVLIQTTGVPPVPVSPPQAGPQAAAGTPFSLFPFPPSPAPPPTITRASEHFLVGGAGGGGAASQACTMLAIAGIPVWAPGSGGGGGGGALALRAGRSLRLGPAARLLAKGGNAASNTTTGGVSAGVPAPAGGGSGGSIVLQSGGLIENVEIAGAIDVRGGAGGLLDRTHNTLRVQTRGGDGAPGFVRLETSTPPSSGLLATMQPQPTPDNLGVLSEADDLVAMRSKFRSTGFVFGPEYVRYEIHATVDGVPRVYSDDPAVSIVEATLGEALRAKFQCAQMDLVTSEVLQLGLWRDRVATTKSETGIASDGFNGFRFALFADYTRGDVITVDRVVVVYRN